MLKQNGKKLHFFDEQKAISEDANDGITAIVPNYNCPPQMLALSIVSLFLNSTDYLKHIIVSINGPDKRTGNLVNQDRKQIFLEKIREYIPITVQRTWSRIGQGQALDSAYPWVFTKDYLVMHDDVLILDPSWCAVKEEINMPSVGAVFYEDPRFEDTNRLRVSKIKDKTYLTFPKLGTEFTIVKKEESHRWSGYWMEGPFVEGFADLEYNGGDQHVAGEEARQIDIVTYEIGSFLKRRLEEQDKKIVKLSQVTKEECVYHYGVFTQSPNRHARMERLRLGAYHLTQIEQKMEEKLPHVHAFYKRYFGSDAKLVSRSVSKISDKSKQLRKNGTGRGNADFFNRPRVQKD